MPGKPKVDPDAGRRLLVKLLEEDLGIHPTHEGCDFVLDVIQGRDVGEALREMQDTFDRRDEPKKKPEP